MKLAGRALAAATIAACLSAACGGSSSSPVAASATGDAGAESGADASVCGRSLPACPAAVPSYSKTVKAVLQAACTPCHYAGSPLASEDLTTYAAVSKIRGSVLTQVYGCAMPPSNGPELSAADRETLLEWLVCAAPNN